MDQSWGKRVYTQLILMVAGQALESHLPQGKSAGGKPVSTSGPLRSLAAPEHWVELLRRVNNNVLPTHGQAYICEHSGAQ